jgi:hypothetical protein
VANNIEKALVNYVLAGVGIIALTSTRVYPFSRPQGSELPAITIERVSGGPLHADDGEVGLWSVHMQVDSWAIDYGSAKDIANQLQSRLSAIADVNQSGITFRYVMLDKEQDFREGGGSEATYEHRISQDYIIWYE